MFLKSGKHPISRLLEFAFASENKAMSCNRLPVALLSFFSATSVHAEYLFNFPEPVTPLAEDALQLHNQFMLIIFAMFFAALGIMAYSLVRHRKSRGHAPASFHGPRTKTQWFGVIAPFVVLFCIDYVVMGIPAYHAAAAMEDTKNGADMVLKVTASQWKWQYEYPNEGIKFVSMLATPKDQINNLASKGEHYLREVDNPVVLPVNRKVRILLMSTDVIHSWWMPQFGVKRDAVPGFLREAWVKIEKPGTYRGQCSQLCGKDHTFMPIVVEAVTEEEYRIWVAQKKTASANLAASAEKSWSKEDLMKHGQGIYEKICIACHQAGGKGLPGAFPALAGSKIVNGPFLDSKGHLIKDGHLDRVMNGKPGTAMQAFKTSLSDTDIAAIVTYERNSFGNSMGDLVQPTLVKSMR